MSFPQYETYKDSGVQWVDPVPAHWQVLALSRVLLEPVTDGPHSTPNFCDEGIPFLSVDGIQDGELIFEGCRFISQRDHDEFSRKAAPRANDILMGKAASVGKIARVKTDVEFSIWSPLALIRVSADACLPEFAEYALKSLGVQAQVIMLANSNTQLNIGMKDIPKLRFGLPPLSEQKFIGAFLDRETAKIDALIAEQEKLITLLAEKRQATISHAVTRGLNPDARMNDSGVAWLGEAPAHWKVGGLTRFIGPIVDYRGRTPTKGEDGMFLVTARNVRTGAIDYAASQEYVDRNEAEKLLKRGAPEVGDVLFTMEAPLGQVAQIDRTDIALAQRIVKFRGLPAILENRFLMFWLMSSGCQARLETLATGSTALGIKASKLGMIECLVPPIDEQVEIVARIDDAISKNDALQSEAHRGIALLKERRAALIAAAVTGQIKVFAD